MFKRSLSITENINLILPKTKSAFTDSYSSYIEKFSTTYSDSEIARPPVCYSPLFLIQNDYEEIVNAALLLHKNIEKLADFLANSPQERHSNFRQYIDYDIFLRKFLDTWQEYCRYDFVIDKNGALKFLEINASCPAGPIIIADIHAHIKEFIDQLNIEYILIPQPIDCSDNFINEMFSMEKQAGFSPNAIAILNDDYGMKYELPQIRQLFLRNGRECIFSNLRDLKLITRELYHKNSKISMAYNKFRVAGITGYDWPSSFRGDFYSYLYALKCKAFLPVNNMMSILYLSDKRLNSMLQDDFFINNASLDRDMLKFLPYSTVLKNDMINYKGINYSPFDFLVSWQNDVVVKHKSMTKGKEIYIGKYINKKEWRHLISRIDLSEYCAQEFVDIYRPEVTCFDGKSVNIERMYQTGAIYIINSKNFGIMSRVSRDIISA